MTDLEDRLRALRPDSAPGDWRDVVERAKRHRRTVVRRRLLVAAALAALAVPALAVAVRFAEWSVVRADDEEIPSAGALRVPYVSGTTIRTPSASHRLAQPVHAPLLGPYTALAVPSPDKSRVAYHAWRGDPDGGTPLIRIHHLRTGADTVFAAGAQSVAWRADGAIGFMRALRPRYESSPTGTLGGRFGHVVVRRPNRAEERWTTLAAPWIVRAWAGSALLVNVFPSYVAGGPQPERGLYALPAPGRSRKLPLDDLAAVSPDGRLAVGPPAVAGDGPTPPRVAVVDVETGRVVAEARLPRGVRTVSGRGSWVGPWIVSAAHGPGGAGSLVFLRYVSGRLAVDRVIRLDRETALTTGVRGFRGVGYGEPTFVDPDGRTLIFRAVVLAEGDSFETMYLTCDRAAGVCRKGSTIRPPTRWAGLVHNPSRPLPTRP